jgi:hypothetical protein
MIRSFLRQNLNNKAQDENSLSLASPTHAGSSNQGVKTFHHTPKNEASGMPMNSFHSRLYQTRASVQESTNGAPLVSNRGIIVQRMRHLKDKEVTPAVKPQRDN